MAVTKRTRFEILRRDGYRCYYCGVRGNETGSGLTIDHVTPVALGGSDDATNLVSACADCNAGKSSVPADAATVADIDRKAAEYAHARTIALRALDADLDAEAEYLTGMWDAWDAAAPSYSKGSAPGEIESFASDWFRRGVPLRVVEKAFTIAWAGPARPNQKVKYAGGVVNNMMAGAEDRTRSMVAGDSVVFGSGYDAGWADGVAFAGLLTDERDLVAVHVDGRKNEFWRVMSNAS